VETLAHELGPESPYVGAKSFTKKQDVECDHYTDNH